MSVNWIITASGNGMLPGQRQVMTSTSDDLLSNFSEFEPKFPLSSGLSVEYD